MKIENLKTGNSYILGHKKSFSRFVFKATIKEITNTTILFKNEDTLETNRITIKEFENDLSIIEELQDYAQNLYDILLISGSSNVSSVTFCKNKTCYCDGSCYKQSTNYILKNNNTSITY